jgi:glutathione S-transferase
MKLFYSPASPYARKVLLAAHQLGLIDRIEVIGATLSPIACDPQVAERNPLGKIPALVTDDGQALYDSRVIVEYLESLGGGTLLPVAPDPARWTALRHQALADGLQDAALLARYETFLRPEPLRWGDWVDGQMLKIDRALDVLEAEVGEIEAGAPLGQIAVAGALGYLDFRFAHHDWRAGRPALSAFYARYAARPDMVATDPSRA